MLRNLMIGTAGLALALGLAAAPAAAATEPLPVTCDRTCLERLVDQFVAALAAHDPSRLPLDAHVRYTENGQAMEVGDGFWATVSGAGRYKHYFVDPEAGEVGFFGTMQENGTLCLMGLRLRVQLGRITEIETVFYRKGNGPAWNDVGMAKLDETTRPGPLWSQPIPPAERATRQQLIATANMYFAGLQRNDGHGIYPFTDDCNRLENGVATTNNPDLKMGDASFNPAAMGCKQQFETGFYGVVTRIHDRRFLVVDPELGTVLAFAVFDHGGTVRSVHLSDGRDFPMPFFSRPSSIEIAEAFRIEKGKIRQIEAIGLGVPYHMSPGWSGGVE